MITLTAEPVRRIFACLLAGSFLVLPACGSDAGDGDPSTSTRSDVGRPSAGDSGRSDADSESFDGGTDDDVDPAGDAGPAADGDTPSDAETPNDTGVVRPDGPTPDYDPNCDLDSDGVMTIGCTVGTTVGTDCDDRNPNIHPDRPEVCDSVDNNCNGQVNEGIECAIFAHTSRAVYRVNIFGPSSAPELIDGAAPGILDFDTAPDGTLYGVNNSGLVRFDAGTSTWERIGGFSLSGANGFAVLTQQIGYITAGTKVYEVDLETGDETLLGEMGGGYSSSGDCVINKDGTLFMSARGGAGASGGDRLVSIELAGANAGRATLIGTMVGAVEVYGLTSAFGQLYAFTKAGKVFRVNSLNGESEEIASFGSSFAWYGAASSPAR